MTALDARDLFLIISCLAQRSQALLTPRRITPRSRPLRKKITALTMSSNPSALYTPQDIKGWTALVTGASSGFGKALCGNQPVRLRRAVRNRNRHAIEQASMRREFDAHAGRG